MWHLCSRTWNQELWHFHHCFSCFESPGFSVLPYEFWDFFQFQWSIALQFLWDCIDCSDWMTILTALILLIFVLGRSLHFLMSSSFFSVLTKLSLIPIELVALRTILVKMHQIVCLVLNKTSRRASQIAGVLLEGTPFIVLCSIPPSCSTSLNTYHLVFNSRTSCSLYLSSLLHFLGSPHFFFSGYNGPALTLV